MIGIALSIALSVLGIVLICKGFFYLARFANNDAEIKAQEVATIQNKYLRALAWSFSPKGILSIIIMMLFTCLLFMFVTLIMQTLFPSIFPELG